jgi:hypothetical protein
MHAPESPNHADVHALHDLGSCFTKLEEVSKSANRKCNMGSHNLRPTAIE